MAGLAGLEPTTRPLTAGRSTVEPQSKKVGPVLRMSPTGPSYPLPDSLPVRAKLSYHAPFPARIAGARLHRFRLQQRLHPTRRINFSGFHHQLQ